MFSAPYALIKQHGLIILIVVLATVLRVWNIDSQAILFGDAAHDLLVAEESVTHRTLPLLGIASSVPRFHQGPLTVWLEMFTYFVVGHQLLAFSLLFAAISIAAVISVYEFATTYISPKVGLIAAWLVALSPLAVAHGRMVYHITPIPLMVVVYLVAVVRLWQKKPRSVFWVVLAWCLAFQFELALLPLLLLIPYVWWRQKRSTAQLPLNQLGAALVIGLVPQIIYDLTHGFTQLGDFGLWVGYRLVAVTGVIGGHALSATSLGSAGATFCLYLGRILTVDSFWLKLAWFVILGVSLVACVRSWYLRRLPPALEVSIVATALLTLSFLIHSAPSEAYFPPYIVLLPLIIGYGVSQLRPVTQRVFLLLIALLGLINIWQIGKHSFFVDNSQTFSYGPSVGEQRRILTTITDLSQGEFTFRTTDPGGIFPNYFDNFRWIAAEQQRSESPNGVVFYLEPNSSELDGYPGAVKINFTNVDLYHLAL